MEVCAELTLVEDLGTPDAEPPDLPPTARRRDQAYLTVGKSGLDTS